MSYSSSVNISGVALRIYLGLECPIRNMVRVVMLFLYLVGKVSLCDGRCSGPMGNGRSQTWIDREKKGGRQLDGVVGRVYLEH